MSRLRENMGLFLVLTGNRLKGKDVKRVGIATHYTSLANLTEFEKTLCETNNLTDESVESILNKYNQTITDHYDTSKIAKLFAENSIEKIYENLEKDATDWSKQQLTLLNKMSPSSLKVAIKQLSLGKTKSLKECLQMEYNLCSKFLEKSDFSEGVRAILIERGSKPNWKPASFKDLDENTLNWYFEPVNENILSI